MDDLERTLDRLRRTLIDRGVRAGVDRWRDEQAAQPPRPESPARAAARAPASPAPAPPPATPAQPPPPGQAADWTWTRIRRPVLAALAGLLAALLVF